MSMRNVLQIGLVVGWVLGGGLGSDDAWAGDASAVIRPFNEKNIDGW